MKKSLPLLLVCLCIGGCRGGSTSYMPLRKGKTWNYKASLHFQEITTKVKVVGPIAVGNGSGWQMESSMGGSRMAWHNGQLVASELAGTRYDPPLILLAPDSIKTPLSWSGRVFASGVEYDGKATLRQENLTKKKDQIEIGGIKYSAIKCLHEIMIGETKVELTTWFSPGIGIIRQEQTRAGDLVPSLEYIGE